jgi:hypothetical protein
MAPPVVHFASINSGDAPPQNSDGQARGLAVGRNSKRLDQYVRVPSITPLSSV